MSTPNDVGTGARLKWLREQRAMSQTEMAKALGISLTGYQRYERGERDFPVELFQTVMDRLGVNPPWLVTGQGKEFIDEKHTPIHLRKNLAEAKPAYPTAGFDSDLMSGIIRMMLERMQRVGRKPDPEAFAKTCIAFYEFSKASGAKPDENAIQRLLETIT